MAARKDTHETPVLRDGHDERRAALRPHNVDACFFQKILPLAGPVAAHFARSISGGERRVVKDPHLHAAPAAFVHDDIHVMPPAGADKIRVRARFDTDSADVRFGDFGDGFAQHCFGFTVLPEKGEQMVFMFSPEKRFQQRRHTVHFLSFRGSRQILTKTALY